jgi:hypothetical protein
MCLLTKYPLSRNVSDMQFVMLVRPLFSSIKPSFFTLLILGSFAASAQLKVELIKVHINYNRDATNGEHTIGELAPAVTLRGTRNFVHELELNKFEKNKGSSGDYYDPNQQTTVYYLQRNFSLGLRYQFTKNLWKKTDGRFLPQLGVSVLPLYASSFYHDPAWHRRKTRQFSTDVAIVPQIKYHIWRRWYCDLAVPLNVFSYEYSHQTVSNAYVRQQSNGGSETHFSKPVDVIKNLHVRLGIAIKL